MKAIIYDKYTKPELLELQEVCDQLTGRAGERQVEGAAVGLVQAEHGVMNGSAVAVLEV